MAGFFAGVYWVFSTGILFLAYIFCRYFNTKIGCRYGDKCAYRHDMATSPRKRDIMVRKESHQKGTIGTTVEFVHKDFIGEDKQRGKPPSRNIKLRDDNEDEGEDDDDLSHQLSTKRRRKE